MSRGRTVDLAPSAPTRSPVANPGSDRRATGAARRAGGGTVRCLVDPDPLSAGVAGQNADHARQRAAEADRGAVLSAVAARWMRLEATEYPFLRALAARLPEHDDREQFLASIVSNHTNVESNSREIGTQRDRRQLHVTDL